MACCCTDRDIPVTAVLALEVRRRVALLRDYAGNVPGFRTRITPGPGYFGAELPAVRTRPDASLGT